AETQGQVALQSAQSTQTRELRARQSQTAAREKRQKSQTPPRARRQVEQTAGRQRARRRHQSQGDARQSGAETPQTAPRAASLMGRAGLVAVVCALALPGTALAGGEQAQPLGPPTT